MRLNLYLPVKENMAKVSYKEKERQRREQEILQKAGELLVERGYANLNMDELADVVGISKPTLYQHFKGKDELIAQVIVNNFKSMESKFEEMPEGTALDRLEFMMRAMIESRYAKKGPLAVLDQHLIWSVVRNHPYIAEQRAQSQERLKSMVSQAQAAGEIDPTIPPNIVIRMMFCTQGVFADPSMTAEYAESEDKLREAIEVVIKMFKRGIAPEKSSS
jgi:AcrR family transcriptional regulator